MIVLIKAENGTHNFTCLLILINSLKSTEIKLSQ